MRRTTIHDIARELNITFSTVARALNDHPAISVATKAAVIETAKRLNYRHNKLASSLRSGRTNVIGVLVPSLNVSFFSSVVHGIEKVMHENGYSILLFQSNESKKQEANGIDTFLQSSTAGIIASITSETNQYEHYAEVKKRNIPLVLFDRTIDELGVPSVTVDDYKGAFLATEHLISQGYTSIVHITSKYSLKIFEERIRGYKDALAFHNLPVRSELIFQGESSIAFGKQITKTLLDRGVQFDAVFASQDIIAMGVIQALKSEAIQIPEQVGVMGFANEFFGALITPSLSTIDQQTIQMGEEAAKLFLRLFNSQNFYSDKPENIVLEPTLIQRESTQRSHR